MRLGLLGTLALSSLLITSAYGSRLDGAKRAIVSRDSASGLGPINEAIEGSDRNKILTAFRVSINPPHVSGIESGFGNNLPLNYIIFDSDFGNDPGDVGALSTLNALADLGECQIIGMANCNTDLSGPGAMDAINTYYGRPDIPVGRNTGTALNPGPYPNIWNTAIATLWPNSFGTNGSTAESATTLYRRLLQSKPDKSVTIIAGGQMANMAALQTSAADANSPYSGVELLARKLRIPVISAGQNPSGNEYNFYTDPTNASNFVNNISATLPVQWNGYEIGNSITTASGLTNNVSVSSPLRYAYDVFNVVESASDRPSWDQVGALVGVRGKSRAPLTYFTESAAGFETVDPAGTNYFTSGTKNQKYLIASANGTVMAGVIDALMNTAPKLSASRPVTQDQICTNLVTAIWKLNEASGGPWIDSVNSLSMTNITGSTITRVTGATNGANTAARFNGTTSGMSTPHTVLLNGGNSPYSITALVKFAVTNADQVIFNKQQGTAVDYFLYLPSGGLARPAFFVYDGAAVSASVGSVTYGGTTLSTNVWYQIEAFVEPQYSGNNARLGIRVNNGTIYYATTSGTPGTNTSSRAAIGINCSSFAGQVLNGDIDYVQFKKTINGHTESTHMYNSGTFKEYPYTQ